MPTAVIKPVHNGVCLRVRAVTRETTCGAPQLAVQVQHFGAATITYVNQRAGAGVVLIESMTTPHEGIRQRREYIKLTSGTGDIYPVLDRRYLLIGPD